MPRYECDKDTLERVTAKAFSQRRKMMRASFKNQGGAAMLEKIGIDPSIRPQDLLRLLYTCPSFRRSHLILVEIISENEAV